MTNDVNIELNTKQDIALYSDKTFIFFIGGLGCGKNFVAALWIYNKIAYLIYLSRQNKVERFSIGIVTAPTYDTLNNATLPALKDTWSLLGLNEDEHYVINKQPPKEWGIKPYSSLRNTRVLTFIFGAYVILDTAENYNKHRGTQFDWFYHDEWRDQNPEAHKVFIGRRRGVVCKMLNQKVQMFITSTMPDDPDQLEHIIESDRENVEYVKSITKDNRKNLPDDYEATMERQLDPLTYRREVLGEIVRIGTMAAWSFDKELNVNNLKIDTQNPIWIIYDFDYSPQVVLINQRKGLTPSGEPFYTVVKEFSFRPGNTETTTETIINYLYSVGFNGEIVTTGDYSGKSRSTKSNTTDWVTINKIFESNKWNYKRKIIPTVSLRNSLNCMNALFNNYQGERRQFISTECPDTIKDVNTCVIDKDNRLYHGVDNEKSHWTACLADFAKTIHPIRTGTQTRMN